MTRSLSVDRRQRTIAMRLWACTLLVTAACAAGVESGDRGVVGDGVPGDGGAAADGVDGASADVDGGGDGAAADGPAMDGGPGGDTNDDANGCAPGTKLCAGTCVAQTPDNGCGGAICIACSSPTFGTAQCSGESCDFACEAGYVKGATSCCPAGANVETCNGRDDDMDGLIDEFSAMNIGSCNSCTAVVYGGFNYWFCTDNRDWGPSRDDCIAKGGQLASVHDQAENDFIAATMVSMGINGRMWMGMNDRDDEGTYAWLDGTPFDFHYINCSTTDLSNSGAEDCGNFSNSNACWDDDDCSGHDFPRLCKAPHIATCE